MASPPMAQPPLDRGVGAAVPGPWRDPGAVSLNRLPMLPAGWVPCPDVATARALTGPRSSDPRSPGVGGVGARDRIGSPWWLSLDGEWEFELLENPEALDGSHLIGGDLPGTAVVPGAWTTQGHGSPLYTNVVMPFGGEPPAVSDDNPTAVHRRTIEVPAAWDDRRIVLRVGSAESMAIVYLDGALVGVGTDSRLPGEFDLTDHVAAGGVHTLALVVPRWSAQTWLEDQDQWFHGGLQRSVALYSTAPTWVSTAKVTTGLARLASRPGRETTGTLEIDVLVEGAGCTEDGWTLSVTLETLRGRELAGSGALEVPHWDGSEMFLALAGSMFTEAGRVRSRIEVPGVEPWSAESPQLYRVVVTLADPEGATVQVGALRVGFRRVEVADRELLINGAPVIIRGVNLHEHDPHRARAVSRDHTRRDLEMIKAANLNAVRGAHYPHDEHLGELCDELGLYLVDEANVESHARQWSLCHDSRFEASIMARITRMAERDVHHPSVIMWSLGNEAGYGRAHDAAAAALRRFDDSRPLHYEGPFMFDIDAPAPVSDVVCPMYTPVYELVDWAQRAEDPRRPLILCEYTHAMGNACGGLVEYDDAFETHPGLQGGFIWEWCEHGIPRPDGTTGPSGAPSWGYAGDFGEPSEEGNFVLDGLVGADRTPHPALEEVRYLGRPLRTRLVESRPTGATLELANQRWFTDTSDLVGHWELTVDGEPVSGGELLAKRPLAPRRVVTRSIRWRRSLVRAGSEVHLTVRFTRRSATSWAPRSQLVAWDHFDLTRSVGVGGGRVSARSDRAARGAGGAVTSPSAGALTGAAETSRPGTVASRRGPLTRFVPFGFTPTLFRALTDNDGISHGWMRGLNGSLTRWVDELALDRCEWDPDRGLLQPPSQVPPLRVRARLGDAGSGWQRLSIEFDLPEELADPPRLGIVWELPPQLEHLEFFADGPVDCYPDRRAGCVAGHFVSTVSAQYVDYGMPQEHGHHTGLRWVALRTARRGPGLMVATVSPPGTGPLAGPGFSARHHSDDELWAASHTGDLAPLDGARATWLSIDVAQRGLGQSSLGPETRERFRIPAGEHRLELLLRHLDRTTGPDDLTRLYRDRPGRPPG